MRVLVTGGAGFIGKKLILRLLSDGQVGGEKITRITCFDVVAAQGLPADDRIEVVTGDLSSPSQVGILLGKGQDAIWHLASAVSGECEKDFDLGYRVNLTGTLNVLDAARRAGNMPRLVFTSSVAAFGGPLPDPIPDDQILTPQTSYGAQKATCELLVADYTRKGMIDGRSLRLPTIVVRPGKPNAAASSFASSIVREPLAGDSVVCPVAPEAKMYSLSPRKVVDALVHAITIPSEEIGQVRSLTLPGLTYTQAEMMAALERVTSKKVVDRVTWTPDPFIQKIVAGWPTTFTTPRAEKLGFRRDDSLEEIIQAHIDDELNGTYAA
ncbi:MAG TPA: D-erythronate dehydrogenase [Geminicoccus sp.]|jgi:nucleoside-diphosphate-sugar epimerase|uniref:D-erythronate dehydrogenase n=1 Tax=Geminicoccus sp. TaxID=2024832 RepID=UPI002E32738A|nr:D-erythronate dehydrogenase [Geminicoccus sp.]HEX2525600.1 D-erythronate dehydrogenase [Geminicoccus sp.]